MTLVFGPWQDYGTADENEPALARHTFTVPDNLAETHDAAAFVERRKHRVLCEALARLAKVVPDRRPRPTALTMRWIETTIPQWRAVRYTLLVQEA